MMLLSWSSLLSAVAAEEWLLMPNGRYYHSSCVHREGEAAPRARAPCPHPSRRRAAPDVESGSGNASYYSDWAVYAQLAYKAGYGGMSSTFSVPPAPKSHGPAGLSSVYLFNGWPVATRTL